MSADGVDEELLALITEHAKVTVKEMLQGTGGVESRLKKHEQAVTQLEKTVGPLADLSRLAQGGAKLMDTITEHVVTAGFGAKVRELR